MAFLEPLPAEKATAPHDPPAADHSAPAYSPTSTPQAEAPEHAPPSLSYGTPRSPASPPSTQHPRIPVATTLGQIPRITRSWWRCSWRTTLRRPCRWWRWWRRRRRCSRTPPNLLLQLLRQLVQLLRQRLQRIRTTPAHLRNHLILHILQRLPNLFLHPRTHIPQLLFPRARRRIRIETHQHTSPHSIIRTCKTPGQSPGQLISNTVPVW